MRVGRVVTVALVALAGVSAAVVPASARSGAVTVEAKPAPGSLTAPGGASWFLLRLAPGATLTQQLDVWNPNTFAITVDVGPVDAHTAPTTGATYAPPTSARKLTSTWITSTVAQVRLAAGEHRSVPFTVRVPADAKPGQYLAAMSASPPPSGGGTQQAGANQAVIQWRLRAQTAIAVEIDVPGPTAPRLVVTGVRAVARSGLLLRVHMMNTGNGFARGSGVVTVPDAGLRDAFPIQTFVPGTAIDFPVPWTHNITPGRHVVDVRLQVGTRVVTWSGAVDITGAMQQEAERAATAAGGSKSSGLPIFAIAAIVLIVSAALALHVRRRRRGPTVVGEQPSLPPRRAFPKASGGRAREQEGVAPRRATAGTARRD